MDQSPSETGTSLLKQLLRIPLLILRVDGMTTVALTSFSF